MKQQSTLTEYISQSIRDNWNLPALTNIDAVTYRYSDVAVKIAKYHLAFAHAGVAVGDKIAFCGRNSAEWAIGILASLTYGAVSVPILPGFTPETVEHLVNHSEARLLFADADTWNSVSADRMPAIDAAIRISDSSLLFSRSEKMTFAAENYNRLFGERYPGIFTPENVDYPVHNGGNLALINYTSGSTGFSKGVMLTYGNLWSNIQFSIDGLDFLKPGDTMLNMLPLAHMFGLTVELLHPLVKGCHVFMLSRTPSPAVLLGAFSKVHPKLVVTVPLIIEKMVKTRVFPKLRRPAMKVAIAVPLLRDKVLAKIRKALLEAFGGNLQQLIVGGAALDKDVEAFLRRIGFPFTVGYGMTECGPLICYAPWTRQRPGSCGKAVDRMELRIDSPDPTVTPGTLWVRGDNVMKGYYRNPEATHAVFDGEWMNTGDICQIDADGYVYIRGRDKNMILGPSGQNIYPEEIEQQINNLPLVDESLVVDRQGKLVALIVPDADSTANMDRNRLSAAIVKEIALLNKRLPSFSQIRDFELMDHEFEKTPKRSIKRFLYN